MTSLPRCRVFLVWLVTGFLLVFGLAAWICDWFFMKPDAASWSWRLLGVGLWAGAVDNVGGPILHWVLATMKQAGTVASIGNAASHELKTTVFPFILRGVSLLGIDSGYMGFPTRQRVWDRLASDLKPRKLHEVTRTIALDDLPSAFDDFVKGRVKGRTVVKVGG